jgi:hypothetical protein
MIAPMLRVLDALTTGGQVDMMMTGIAAVIGIESETVTGRKTGTGIENGTGEMIDTANETEIHETVAEVPVQTVDVHLHLASAYLHQNLVHP